MDTIEWVDEPHWSEAGDVVMASIALPHSFARRRRMATPGSPSRSMETEPTLASRRPRGSSDRSSHSYQCSLRTR